MKKYAVICLTAVLLFILTGCNTVVEIKPAETADEAAKQYIAMMKSGDKDLITDPEGYEQIIKAFDKDAWDNAEYTIYEGNCPETREGWIMHSSGIEISEEEAANANSAFWEKVASDHNTTIEKITLSPDETYTEDEWIHLSSLYRDYVDRQPAWPPVSFPLYDYAKVSFTFAGQDEDSEGNGDYHIHISNKNGLWEVAEPLSFNSGAYEPIDEYSIKYENCLFTLWDEQDVIERQPINLRILSREDTKLGYGADTYTGCHEMIIRYEGLTMKTFRSNSIDSRYHLVEMEVTDKGFKTYRNIQVGDTLEYLMKQYPELEHPDYMPHSYIMDNGGQGIQFIVSDNTVRKIILKHGFDGPPYFEETAFAADTDFEQHKDYPADDFELRDDEIANYLSYRYEDKSMYFAGFKVFDEFGASNEGGLIIIPEDNTLIFSITKATGTVTGAVDGPNVYFVMDLTDNTIVEKRFNPAPNYAELGITEFIEHSEEVIELSDERMIEIGLYFKEMIEQIESKM